MALIELRAEGLYCARGDFHIDPWRPVERAIVTHGHSDHARAGHTSYLAVDASAPILRRRLGADLRLQTLSYGESIERHGVRVSLHPAGHILGSAQVRVEHAGEVWVASGDYKLEADPTCPAFEPLRCHAFITESTFGLPVYRWAAMRDIFHDVNQWWAANAAERRTSVIYCYALGKAQRLLANLRADIGPIVTHGAIEPLNTLYRAAGVALPHTLSVADLAPGDLKTALVLAPPAAQSSAWMKRFADYRDAFASGWMQVRGARRRRGVDRGIVLSDHADWPALQTAIHATGAERVFVTHGQVDVLVRWLREQGLSADAMRTAHGDEDEDREDGQIAAAQSP